MLLEKHTIWLREHEEHLAFAPVAVVYLKSIFGEIEIRICELCGYEDVFCLHTKNVVDTKTLFIECRLCGY